MFINALKSVPARAEDGTVNVFVETPTGSRHKYDLDQHGLFRIGIELPQGTSFPFSFGFVPNTRAEDGDALDVILLTDGVVPAGALIMARLIGVLKMENDEDGQMVRNDRVVAVAAMSRIFQNIKTLEDTRDGFAWDIENFFESYNRMIGRPFKIVGRGDQSDAMAMLEASEETES